MPFLPIVLALALQTVQPVDLKAEVAAIKAGEVDVLDYDWGRLRFHPDRQAAWAAMDEVERHAGSLQAIPDHIAPGQSFSSCLLGEEGYAILMGIRAAKLTPDAEAYAEALSHARETAARTETELRETIHAIVADEVDPLVRELRTHHARDVAWRSAGFSVPDGAGPHFREVALARALPRTCAIDAASTAFMRRAMDQIGWFSISGYGEDADAMAWLLVQHADDDRELQTEVLDTLSDLAAAGETAPRNYAMLFDRVAVGTGRPQRYGTQGTCSGGRWLPMDIEDRDGVDARRAELGLEPLAELASRHTARGCR
jgi:hypothetical protein